VLCAVTHIFAYWTSPVSVTHVIFFHRRVWYRKLSLCYAHTMRVFNVQASSSSKATLVPNFVSVAASIVELARGESRTQSITQ